MSYLVKEVDSKDVFFFKKVLRKKNKSRVIYSVDDKSSSIYKDMEKSISKRFICEMSKKENFLIKKVPYAYYPGRSANQNAKAHQPFDFTLSMDIRDHFTSITPKMVDWLLTPRELYLCFIDGSLPQGLSTSPVISNIAMMEVDRAILSELSNVVSNGSGPINGFVYRIKNFRYTRYSDDLVVSFNLHEPSMHLHRRIFLYIEALISKTIRQFGFEPNNNKVKMQNEKSGFRVITGVSVSREIIKPTRKTKRKLRSAIHNANIDNAIGLYNWIKLVSRT